MEQSIIVEHFGNNKLGPIHPVTNEKAWIKPSSGGLWTSPVESTYNWEQWCKDEDCCIERLSTSFLLEIKTDRICIINSYQDLKEKMINPGFMYLKFGRIATIDFERMAEHYDGIWLTADGEGQTRYTSPFNYMLGTVKRYCYLMRTRLYEKYRYQRKLVTIQILANL